MFRLILVALLLLAGACTTGAGRIAPLAETGSSPYRLGTGDEVRVTVFGLDAANNSYVVGDTGMIAVPLLAPVAAAGKTVDELQAALVQAISARELLRAPSVSVQIQKYRPFFILGEVQRPGQYPFVPGMSVLAAVSTAGGFTFRADTKGMIVSRASGTAVIKGRAAPEALVQPGDTINVLESWF